MIKPTKEQVLACIDRTLPDLIRPHLRILFCGINPGLYSAAIGHHFGRPGNRLWKALYLSGLTPRVLSPYDAPEFLALGFGITNLVARATATADSLRAEEFRAGLPILVKKIKRHQPAWVAFLGVGAYRTALARPDATVGPQPDHPIGTSRVWVLPNPSGLNAHYPLPKLAEAFAELRQASQS